MKLIARILLILAAAGAIAGASIALVGASRASGGGPRRGAPAQIRPGVGQAFPGQGGQQRRGEPGGFDRSGERGPSLFGVGEVLKNLVIIGLIVAVVAPLARLLGRLRPGA